MKTDSLVFAKYGMIIVSPLYVYPKTTGLVKYAIRLRDNLLNWQLVELATRRADDLTTSEVSWLQSSCQLTVANMSLDQCSNYLVCTIF